MDEKLKALKAVEADLNKQFKEKLQGDRAMCRLGERAKLGMPVMPTNLYTLDYDAIGCGGIPKGRIIEVFGPESSGKTTFALHVIAQEQARGELCAFIDAEHSVDPAYAKRLGVDIDNLIFAQPDAGEQALETAEALVRSRTVSIVVIDSVAALVPQRELDGDMGDAHMGLQARMMSQAMRKLRGAASINGVTIIFINQIREKVGVMFGSPEVTTGGRALKFYASVRIDVRRVSGENGKGKIMSGDVQIGHQMRLKIVKNKVGPPHREAVVDLIYGMGIDTMADLIQYALNINVLHMKGSWVAFDDENVGQGIAKAKENIKDNPKLLAAVKAEVEKARKAMAEAEAE